MPGTLAWTPNLRARKGNGSHDRAYRPVAGAAVDTNSILVGGDDQVAGALGLLAEPGGLYGNVENVAHRVVLLVDSQVLGGVSKASALVIEGPACCCGACGAYGSRRSVASTAGTRRIPLKVRSSASRCAKTCAQASRRDWFAKILICSRGPAALEVERR